MFTYACRRAVQSTGVLLVVSILCFAVLHMLGGGPFTTLLPSPVEQIAIQNQIGMLGLDEPVWVQYLRWFGKVLHGQFGSTFDGDASIGPLVMTALEHTFMIVGVAWLLAVCIAVPWGIHNSRRQYGVSDTIASLVGFVGYALPGFWLGIMCQEWFSLRYIVFPISGMYDNGRQGNFPNLLMHMIMPVTVLTVGLILSYLKHTKSSMLEAIPAEFVRTARAKGASDRRVVNRHVFKNALIPIITVLAADVPLLLGGSAVLETVFDWPGVGQLFVQSVHNREYSVVMAIVVVSALLSVGVNLLADILYAVVDPRVRLNTKDADEITLWDVLVFIYSFSTRTVTATGEYLSAMFPYLVRRLLQAVFVFFIVSAACFYLMHSLGGGPFTVLLPSRAAQAAIQRQMEITGLHLPIWDQYLHWMVHFLKGNLGTFYQGGYPVAPVVMACLKNTFMIVGIAWLLSVGIAVSWGVYNSSRPYGVSDSIASVIGFVGFAMPAFWLGMMFQVMFSFQLFWLPPSSMYDMGHEGDVLNLIPHLVMPVTVLTVGLVLGYMKYTQSSMLEVLPSEFVRTARAKGASEKRVLYVHAFRNAMIPVITVIANDVSMLMGSVAVVETVFHWPGIGALLVQSAHSREYSVVMAIIMITAGIGIALNVLADILYTVVDPRIRGILR